MLADAEIRAAIETGDLVIEPFNDECVEPASYDLSVGRVLLAGRGIVDPRRDKVILRTGDWAEIETLERLELSTNIAATYGVRSGITRRGIAWYGGPQIDPGYNGRLFVSIFNPTSEPFEINWGDRFCTLMFHRLKVDAHQYSGRFQGLNQFPEEDVERMLKMSAPTLGDVVLSVGVLEQTVQKLTEATSAMARDMGWVKYLLGAILISMVGGIVAGVIVNLIGD